MMPFSTGTGLERVGIIGPVRWLWTLDSSAKTRTKEDRRGFVDECKTHLCFEFISHAILCILFPYSCKTHKISSKLGFVGLLMKSK